MARRRRSALGWALFVAFVIVPLAELYVLVQVGQVIGAWWTIVLLIVAGFAGSWLIKREGARAWGALREALESGRMPAREIADGALVLLGGTLLLAPGFLTDVVGVLLAVPLTRPLFRGLLTRVVERRLDVIGPIPPGFGAAGGAGGPGSARRPGPGPQGPVVQGEVVDE